MSDTSASTLIAAHLGIPTHAAGLIATRSFRSITVTRHRPRETNWNWAPISPRQPSVVVLFTGEDQRMPGADADAGAPIGLYLPAATHRRLEWHESSEVLAVWVPEKLLVEFTEGGIPPASELYATPLTIGFRTFAQAVVKHADDGSSMSRYAIERLLAEMTFGALLEQQSVEADQRPSSLVERARSVMLMHREDSAFSTPQLAAELHISQRQLQRAFSRAGLTPVDLLRRMRVELAESLLRNPLYSGLTVDEVARYSGFTSALQLRRALQAEGSPSPTALRSSLR